MCVVQLGFGQHMSGWRLLCGLGVGTPISKVYLKCQANLFSFTTVLGCVAIELLASICRQRRDDVAPVLLFSNCELYWL